MEVGIEVLIPGVEDGDKAGFAAEVVLTEGEKGLRAG